MFNSEELLCFLGVRDAVQGQNDRAVDCSAALQHCMIISDNPHVAPGGGQCPCIGLVQGTPPAGRALGPALARPRETLVKVCWREERRTLAHWPTAEPGGLS